jgi:hypothetical protein
MSKLGANSNLEICCRLLVGCASWICPITDYSHLPSFDTVPSFDTNEHNSSTTASLGLEFGITYRFIVDYTKTRFEKNQLTIGCNSP